MLFRSNLKFLGKSDANIELISTQITEFKKHGITVEGFETSISGIQDQYLKAKMNDMLIVYKEFENILFDRYIDENDMLTILGEQLEKTDMFKNTILYIDEFVGFTKQEYTIISKLIKTAKQFTATVCTDNLELTECPEDDIFYSNKQTADNLLQIAKKEKKFLEKPIYLQDTKRFKTIELEHLEKSLLN